MGMIVIKNVDFMRVARDPVEVAWDARASGSGLVFDADGESEPVPVEVFTELIHGRRFVRPSDGTDIVVGCSRQAQEVLGLMYEAFDNMEVYCRDAVQASHEAWTELERVKGLGFWGRLKFLFRGAK